MAPDNSSLRTLGWQVAADGTNLGAALDKFLSSRATRPQLLALGEPMHGAEAFPLLRNHVLAHLVAYQGFRSIALETDCLAALVVNDYVTRGTGSLDQVLDAGFSHGFGNIAANKELVTWIRAYNEGCEPAEQVRFYGFDTPSEMSGAASPRTAMTALHDYLTAHLEAGIVPHTRAAIEALLGNEDVWTNPAAALDPTQSVGNSTEARQLRVITDDLLSVLESESPGLRRASSAGDYQRARLYARTACGLLREHAAIADQSANNTTRLIRRLATRDISMAANLSAVAGTEAQRGPSLVFAHNNHLHRNQSAWNLEGMDLRWWPAGAHTATRLGSGYAVIATDLSTAPQHGIPQAEPDTLQGALAAATKETALFPTEPLAETVSQHSPLAPRAATRPEAGYFPLNTTNLTGIDAIAFINHAS